MSAGAGNGQPSMKPLEALKRSSRSVFIGLGAAVGVWGSIYLWQNQLEQRANDAMPSDWTLLTKMYVRRAQDNHSAAEKVKWYNKAIENLVTLPGGGVVDLHSKSTEWLAGYADLLRRLGLAQAEVGQDPTEPLLSSDSIPFGDQSLREQASVALYRQTKDEAHLLRALQFIDPESTTVSRAKVPATLSVDHAPVYLEIAKRLLSAKDYSGALNIYIGLHRALPREPEPLCVRPGVAGLAGQVMWQLKHTNEAQKWLKMSEQDASLLTSSACRDCAALARQLSARTN